MYITIIVPWLCPAFNVRESLLNLGTLLDPNCNCVPRLTLKSGVIPQVQEELKYVLRGFRLQYEKIEEKTDTSMFVVRCVHYDEEYVMFPSGRHNLEMRDMDPQVRDVVRQKTNLMVTGVYESCILRRRKSTIDEHVVYQ